jgi:hypothetical protein
VSDRAARSRILPRSLSATTQRRLSGGPGHSGPAVVLTVGDSVGERRQREVL